MENSIAWSMVRLVQRLAMVLTLGCCAYIIFFLYFKSKDNPLPDNSAVVSTISNALVSPVPVFDLRPYVASSNDRDIFSIPSTDNSSGNVQSTPKGQLPDHLKIVGIVISNQSQIIIEDTTANQTYFISEGHPQAGIKIVKVGQDRMIINYQGQDIPIAVNKS